MYPAGYGLCTQCGDRIEPASEPDPAWGGSYNVITVPVVPQGILDVVHAINRSHRTDGPAPLEPDYDLPPSDGVLRMLDDMRNRKI